MWEMDNFQVFAEILFYGKVCLILNLKLIFAVFLHLNEVLKLIFNLFKFFVT